MLFPEPVGATNRTSAPDSAAATTSPWPGRNSESPKTSRRTARAAADGWACVNEESAGTCRRYQVDGTNSERGLCHSYWVNLFRGSPRRFNEFAGTNLDRLAGISDGIF